MNMEKGAFDQLVVLISSLNPRDSIVSFVKELQPACWKQILVVNDGSQENRNAVFASLQQMAGVTVLSHAKNQGKGRALKTGFSYCLEQYPECTGVITVDCDGQHLVCDVFRVAQQLQDNPRALILGMRDFAGKDVPFRHGIGNRIFSVLFQILYGKRLQDTQTGLRGINRELLTRLVKVPGEKFEYELRMLILASREKLPFVEIPIETIFIDENASSHFRPVRDSARIYSVLFASFVQYMLSSLSAALLDVIVFIVLNRLVLHGLSVGVNITLSTLLARVVSATYNFVMNHKLVFQSSRSMAQTAIRFYAIVGIQIGCSAASVSAMVKCFGFPTLLTKVVVDSILFLIGFQIQQHLVFAKEEPST